MSDNEHKSHKLTEQQKQRIEHQKKTLIAQALDLKRVAAHNKFIADKRASDQKEADKIAASLKPLYPHYQTNVTARLNGLLSEELGKAIRTLATSPERVSIKWLSANAQIARDCMTRAFPLALQMGYMCVPQDSDMSIKLANGNVIEFSWPGKE